MDSKEINEQEVKEVNGGQSVMPIIFADEVDEQMIAYSGITAHCKKCGFSFPVPASRRGKQIECQSCHEYFIV